MSIKHILAIFIFISTGLSNIFAQTQTETKLQSENYPSSVIHLGFLPQTLNATWLRDNINFATDSIVLDERSIYANGITFSSATAIKYFVEYQKYTGRDRLWSFQFSFLQKNIDQFIFDDMVDTSMGPIIVPPDPIFELSERKVGVKQNLQIGASVGHLWNLVNYKDRFIMNIGPSLRADYYKIDYYKYDQIDEAVLKTDQDGLNLGLAVQFEITWRFAPRFSIGMNLQGNLLDQHITFSNDLNLNADNPLNDSFFRRPISNGTAAFRVGYYF